MCVYMEMLRVNFKLQRVSEQQAIIVERAAVTASGWRGGGREVVVVVGESLLSLVELFLRGAPIYLAHYKALRSQHV